MWKKKQQTKANENKPLDFDHRIDGTRERGSSLNCDEVVSVFWCGYGVKLYP